MFPLLICKCFVSSSHPTRLIAHHRLQCFFKSAVILFQLLIFEKVFNQTCFLLDMSVTHIYIFLRFDLVLCFLLHYWLTIVCISIVYCNSEEIVNVFSSVDLRECVSSSTHFSPHTMSGWQKLHGSTGGSCRKVWTWTKILSPNIRYFVVN